MGTTNTPWRIDEAVIRRIAPCYITMPTSDDRRKMLKALLKDEDHFILKEDLESLVSATAEYSFDDLGNLMHEVSNFVRMVTIKSEYFKLTPEVEGYEETWTPCFRHEKGAKRRTYEDLVYSGCGIALPTITKEVVDFVISKTTPTVSTETVEKCNLFYEKGKRGVDEMLRAKAARQ